MKHGNTTIQAEKGKNNMVLLLVIGIIGVLGLVYVLNASSGKSSFSETDALQTPSISMVE